MSERIILWQALIPGGQVVAAENLARVSFPSTGADHDANALIVATAALLCADHPGQWLVHSIEQRAQALPVVRASTVLLHGLLAAVHRQRDSARRLMESVEQFDSAFTALFHRQLATEWLMAEAADAGDPGRLAELRKSWWLQPSTHTELTPWLQRLWPAAFAPPKDPPKTASWPEQKTSLETALATHAAVLNLRKEDIVDSDIERLALAWRNALRDDTTTEHLKQRSTALGLREPSEYVDHLQQQLVVEFTALLRAPAVRWGEVLELSPPLTEALRQVRDEALRELEEMAARLERRAEAKRELPIIDEWMEWNTLRTTYERTARAASDADRRLAFQSMKHVACNYGVWLANERQQSPTANAIFRWLLNEALAVKDASTDLYRRNAEATRGT